MQKPKFEGSWPPCVSIFIDGNEAKTHARDLKVFAVIDTGFPAASAARIHLEGPKFLVQYKFGPSKKGSPLINPKNGIKLNQTVKLVTG